MLGRFSTTELHLPSPVGSILDLTSCTLLFVQMSHGVSSVCYEPGTTLNAKSGSVNTIEPVTFARVGRRTACGAYGWIYGYTKQPNVLCQY
jgi:hypothetical protein